MNKKMYFKNKFDEDFLRYCNLIENKGASVRVKPGSSPFFEMTTNPSTGRVKVIPLVLFNKIRSDNPNDINIDDYMMLCENTPNTSIRATYDETYTRSTEEFVCQIAQASGDFKELLDEE